MEYITQIQEIVRLAGAEAMKYFNHIKENAVSCKGTPKDIVSTADKAVETLIAAEVKRRFPGHGMYGEEYGRRGQESPFCWVVDPIDGTQSFVHGHPFFCISIALKENDTTIAGCVFAPRLNMMFSAERGKGAFEDGRPIRVSGCDRLSSAVVATGFACLRAGLKKNNMPIIDRVFPIAQDIKRCGSAALDLCFVAAGRVDVYWEIALKEYDVAAGALIASEAGAAVLDMNGGTNYPSEGILCTNAPLVPVMLDHFKAAIGHVDPTPA